MKLKFIKLIRVPIICQLSDGTEREGYRYMDTDGGIIAESIKGEVYPSAIREMELEAKLEAKQVQDIQRAKAETEQDAQAEWETTRERMKEALAKRGKS